MENKFYCDKCGCVDRLRELSLNEKRLAKLATNEIIKTCLECGAIGSSKELLSAEAPTNE